MGIQHKSFSPNRSLAYFDALTNPSDRKLRLFMIECVRREADVLHVPALRSAVGPYADYLDGRLSFDAMFTAFDSPDNSKYRDLLRLIARPTARSAARSVLVNSVQRIARVQTEKRHPDLQYANPGPGWEEYWAVMSAPIPAEDEIRQAWLTDIFGEQQTAPFPDSWRSESAVALARTAYDTRNFTLLPILADALEEAGCDHPDVLAHCRDPRQVHVRGCWVVDLVLNKS